jgi:methylmalonyl-CoA mutase cobalamin-binding domain/chain
MDITKETILDRLPDEADRTVREFIDAAMVEMEQQAGTPSSHVSSALPHGDLAKHYLDALLTGSRQQATSMILEAAESGTSIADIYMHVFQPVQYEIGRLWQINRINVAQEHYCTAVTQAVMSQLYPRLFAGDRTGRTLVATCVAGELHEIGVRMVADFFEMAGWDTYYLGASTPPSDIVRALVDRNADLLAISSTMTWHVRAVRELIDATRESDAHGIRILVGGHPFNTSSELWRKFGADGYAADAKSAVALADQLLRNGAN